MKRLVQATLLAVAVVILFLTTTAGADDSDRPEAGVSLDGTTYRDSLDGPLFDDDVTWSPGDVRVSRFWVRSTERGDLAVALDSAEVSRLVDAGHVKVAARVRDQPWQAVKPGRPAILAQGPAADGLPVAVRVVVVRDAPASASLTARDVSLTVRMGDTQVVGPAVVRPGHLGAGPGEAATWWVVPLGLMLLSAGALVYGRRETLGEVR